MPTLLATPSFLRGSWSRNWIPRTSSPNPGDDSVTFCGVQAGYYFVDVRGGASEGNMAFSGVTSVTEGIDGSGGGLGEMVCAH